jgi:hypothetical protein
MECRWCHAAFIPNSLRSPGPSGRPPRGPDGSGFATWSFVLGLGSVLTSLVCGAGVVFGLGGLLMGFGGLQSRRRGVGIAGLVLSLAGVLLSIGVIVVGICLVSAIQRSVPPKPDGTQAPFASHPN